MQLFQRINVDFFVGIGYGVVGRNLDLLYELINSINIHFLCFIYLFIIIIVNFRIYGVLVFVSVCSFEVAYVCGFVLFHCFARLDH